MGSPESFKPSTQSQNADSLADLLPGGRVFEAKHLDESVLRKLLIGLAGECLRAESDIFDVSKEYLPDETDLFIEEWEKAVGIPDSCFDIASTIDQRRRNVLIKLGSLGVSTEQDFIDLAALFGITITIRHLIDEIGFTYTFPILLYGAKEARFTMIVETIGIDVNRFPMEFPITFGNDILAILECLFNKLKPANVKLIFNII